MNIIERPYNISYSLNEIRYVFQLDQLLRPGLQLQVKLLIKNVAADSFMQLYTFLLKPAPDGTVYLLMQDYLNSVLEYVLPAFNSSQMVTNADWQACNYTIHYRELTDADTDPVWITSETDYYSLFCIKGGIEKHLHSRNNFFKYFENNQPFLTWQPPGRFIDLKETAFLTFLNPHYGGEDLSQSFALCYRLTDINRTAATGEIPFGVNGLLFHLRIALLSVIPNELTAPLYSLEVGVIQSGDEYAFKYRFYFEYRPTYTFYDLLYINSLGGIDTMRVKGNVTETVERTLQEGTGGLDLQSTFRSFTAHESFYAGIQLQKKFKGDIGYLNVKTKGAQYAYLDVLASHAVYMPIAFRYVPVIALQKSQDLGSKKDSLQSFPIEWALSESNEVYTPGINFGLGDLNNIGELPPLACPVAPDMHLVIDPDTHKLYLTFTQFSAEQLSQLVQSLQLKVYQNGDALNNWIAYNPSNGTTMEILTAITGYTYYMDYKTICMENESEVNRTPSVSYTATPPPPDPTGSITLVSNTGTSGSTRNQVFQIGDTIIPGDNYNVEVYSHKVVVVAVDSDTPASIASKLALEINNTTATQWDSANAAPNTGTPGFKPTATNNGANLSIVLNIKTSLQLT